MIISSFFIKGILGLSKTCSSIYGIWINPALICGYFVEVRYKDSYIIWLQTKVPAVLEIVEGILFLFNSSTIAFIGSVEKYAFSPSFRMASSIGLFPILSGILASSILIAIRSGVILLLPPAWPTQITKLGENKSIFSSRTRELSLKTVGRVIFFISILSITSGKLLTHKLEGLILS